MQDPWAEHAARDGQRGAREHREAHGVIGIVALSIAVIPLAAIKPRSLQKVKRYTGVVDLVEAGLMNRAAEPDRQGVIDATRRTQVDSSVAGNQHGDFTIECA